MSEKKAYSEDKRHTQPLEDAINLSDAGLIPYYKVGESEKERLQELLSCKTPQVYSSINEISIVVELISKCEIGEEVIVTEIIFYKQVT